MLAWESCPSSALGRPSRPHDEVQPVLGAVDRYEVGGAAVVDEQPVEPQHRVEDAPDEEALARLRAGYRRRGRRGLDRLGQHRTFDTDALAAAFPFASPELPADSTPAEATNGTDFAGADASGPGPSSAGAGFGAAAAPAGGVLYGYNLGSRSLVFWDRFACDNYNSVILGRSGAGKSYLVKLELLRSLYRGVDGEPPRFRIPDPIRSGPERRMIYARTA